MQNTAEDISHQAQGYKATLSNPNVSEAAKQNAQQALNDLGGEDAFYGKKGDPTTKNESNVRGGLKAAINNPDDNDHTVYESGKQAAKEKLQGTSDESVADRDG